MINQKSARKLFGIFSLLMFICACEVGEPDSLSPTGIKKVEVQANQIMVYSDRTITPGAYIIPSPPRLIITMENAEIEKDALTKGKGTGELIKDWELEQKILRKQVQKGTETEELENRIVQLNVNLSKVNVSYQLTTTESGFNLVLEEIKKPEEEEKPQAGVVIPKELYPEIKKMEIGPGGAPTGKVVVAVSPAEEQEAREMLKDIIPEKAKVEKRPPASALENITYRSMDKSFEVIVQGDGAFLDYKLDSLTDPVRIVIDLFGIKNKLTKKVFQVNDGKVRQIRVGDHPGKTRVVIEFSGKIRDARVVSIENKIIVKILF